MFYYATDSGVFSRTVSGAWVTYFTVAGGGSSAWALVGSSALPSPVTTVAFTGLSGLTQLLLVGQNITKSQARAFLLQVSIDNGSNWLTSSGDYVGFSTNGSPTNVTAVPLTSNTSTAARNFSARIDAINLTSPKTVSSSGGTDNFIIPTANDIDAIRVLLDGAGDLSAGNLYLYGR